MLQIECFESVTLLPMLPNRLAYPELIRAHADIRRFEWFTYDGSADDFAIKVSFLSRNRDLPAIFEARKMLERELRLDLNWQKRAKELDARLDGLRGL